MQKKVTLRITPQTWVKAIRDDKKLFILYNLYKAGRYDKMSDDGIKRVERLQRYNEYKAALMGVAKAARFILPEQGAEITFFIPVSKSWKKHKKSSMHLKLHRFKPDLSNLLKAMEDSLLTKDEGIANYAGLTKKWINEPVGKIEIIIHSPRLSSEDVLS